MNLEEIQKLVQRFDKALGKKESATLKVLSEALQNSFDRLELEIRRRYPQMEEQGGLLVAQRNSVVLLQQIKVLMQLIDPEQAKRMEAEFKALIESATAIGIDYAQHSIRTFDRGAATFSPQVPVEAAVYAAQDSIGRLQRHGQEFASKAAAIVAQGLIQNWGMTRTISLMHNAFELTKSQAETIVRTESMQAMTKAQMATYEANEVRYVARLTAIGDHVCRICAGRSGEVLPIDKMIVILHPRCRCIAMPVLTAALKAKVQSLDWLQKFHEQVVNALPAGVTADSSKIAPFEKSAGIEKRPEPVWTPKRGAVDAAFIKASGL